MKSGVYKIINLVNNKIYVGSAVNFEIRWRNHKSELKRYKHHSPKLQNSYNKHGIDNFKFEIIEECVKEKLIEREQYYIDLYDSYKNGYNCCPKADSNLGRRCSEETKIKIGKANKGRKMPKESIEKSRQAHIGLKFSEETKKEMSAKRIGRNNPRYNPTPILQYDLKDKFIKEWQDFISLKDAGFDSTDISRVCKKDKNRKVSHGYKWKFKN